MRAVWDIAPRIFISLSTFEALTASIIDLKQSKHM
jgi:hypothetical protein